MIKTDDKEMAAHLPTSGEYSKDIAGSSPSRRESSSSETRESSSSLSSDKISSSSSNGKLRLPLATSFWKKEHILQLNIYVSSFCETSKTPSDIVNLIDVWQTVKEKMEFDGRVKLIASKIRDATFALSYGLTEASFDDTSMCNVLQLTSEDAWKIKDLRDEEQFKSMFQVNGRAFTKWLRYCLHIRDKKEDTVSEHMYQQLFSNFLLLFGVHCEHSSCIPEESIRIQDSQVSGLPDLVAKWYRRINNSILEPEYDYKTIFVCKVKKEFNGDDQPSPKKFRYSSPSTKCGSAMLGQHGGDLLLYYKSSLMKNTIIGMIVEKTNVSFTALLATEKQFDNIIGGTMKADPEKGPKMIHTRPYDFMNKEDRAELIEPLLKLGFIQDIGENSFN